MNGVDATPSAPGPDRGAASSSGPGLRGPRADEEAADVSTSGLPAWLAPWARPRPLLFSLLFVGPFVWAVVWHLLLPKPSLPLTAGPGVTLAETDLSVDFGEGPALAVRSVASQLESQGFRTDADLAASAVVAGEPLRLSFRLLVAGGVPCFAELRTGDGGLPRLRLVTALATGGLVITSSRSGEPELRGDPRMGAARLFAAPAASPTALLLRHQAELTRLGRQVPADADLSRSRYATLLSMMLAGGLR